MHTYYKRKTSCWLERLPNIEWLWLVLLLGEAFVLIWAWTDPFDRNLLLRSLLLLSWGFLLLDRFVENAMESEDPLDEHVMPAIAYANVLVGGKIFFSMIRIWLLQKSRGNPMTVYDLLCSAVLGKNGITFWVLTAMHVLFVALALLAAHVLRRCRILAESEPESLDDDDEDDLEEEEKETVPPPMRAHRVKVKPCRDRHIVCVDKKRGVWAVRDNPAGADGDNARRLQALKNSIEKSASEPRERLRPRTRKGRHIV